VLKTLAKERCVAIPKLLAYDMESSSLQRPMLVTNKVGLGTMYEVPLPLPQADREQMMADLHEAVATLHRHNLVYFDWHPANVMYQSLSPMRALLVDYNECVPNGTYPERNRFNEDFAAAGPAHFVSLLPIEFAFDHESLLYIEEYLSTGTLPWLDNDDGKYEAKINWLHSKSFFGKKSLQSELGQNSVVEE
jgi:hypothetical protein